ncbi:MAG TPA: hypothetical protein VFH95_03585 [Candidatus Kapabacteria bacterium]|nr:hypothetical protein [Candidatus Kapabacteria bacterium]
MRTITSKGFLALAFFAALAAASGGQAWGQWVQTNGPYGGEAEWIIHVGPTVYSNQCRSSDGGLHWVQIHQPPYYYERIFWFDGKLYGLGAIGDPNYVSLDTGITWQVDSTPWPFDHIVPPAFFGDLIMIAPCSQCGVRFSLDGGITWVERDGGLPSYGLTWDGDPRDPPTYDSSIHVSSIAFIDGVAFVAIPQSLGTSVYRSLDTGKHWQQCGADDGSQVTEITGTLSNLFALDSSGIFRSTDSGNTWKSEKIGLTDSAVETLFLSNSGLYAGTHGEGIFHSLDSGNTWIASNDGLSNLYLLSFDTVGTSILAGTLSGIFRSTDEGSHWTCTGFPVVDVTNLIASGPFLLAGSYEMIVPYYKSSLYRSSDNGNVWTSIMQGVYPQCMATENGDIFMSGVSSYPSYASSGLLKSTDHGDTWQKLGFSDTGVTALSVSGSNILAGIYIQGYPYNYYAVYSSTNYGLSWSSVLSDSTYGTFSSFATHGNIIIAAGRRVFRSSDGGASWDTTSIIFDDIPSAVWNGNAFFISDYYSMFRSNDGLTWSRVDSAGWPGTRQLATYGNIVFDADNGSFNFSSDDGSSWTIMQDNLFASSECVTFKDGYVFVGSNNSVWRRPLSDFGISSVAQTPVAAQTEIHSFPNPFTQSTEITFTTQAAGYAEVSIVNALGAEVARLYSGTLGAGNHSFAWKAGDLSPGNYWCVVRMNGHSEQEGLLLER